MHQNPADINGFHSLSDQHRFLSNTYQWEFTLAPQVADSPVAHLAGLTAVSAEHFYQAARTLDRAEVASLLQAETPAYAIGLGRQLELRLDWVDVRFRVMEEILRSKFSDPDLRELLLETRDARILNLNTWHDTVWGICTCARHAGGEGENHLGRLLTELRTELAAAAA